MTKARFARMISMQAKPGRGDEFLKEFRDGVAATAVEIKGMRRLYLLRPVEKDDEFVVISLWDDEGAAEDYAKSGKDKKYEERLAKVQKGKEKVSKYRVEVHVLGKGVRGRE
jgi:heme-degrading monooxygenase HmoA